VPAVAAAGLLHPAAAAPLSCEPASNATHWLSATHPAVAKWLAAVEPSLRHATECVHTIHGRLQCELQRELWQRAQGHYPDCAEQHEWLSVPVPASRQHQTGVFWCAVVRSVVVTGLDESVHGFL